tara:strand:- start:29 stop:817 length:789 start_codon:yes stop_codon:yes gene_type:complete
MKTWMKVVLGIIAAIILILGLVFWLTGDMTKTGDDFFDAVQNDDINSAYELLSEDFQAGTSREELASYLAANALDKIKDVSWGSRSLTDGMGTLDGSVTTATGGKIPLILRLVKSDDGWRINAIEKEKSGFTAKGGEKSLPTPKAQEQLFRETTKVFADSLADRSMKKLYDYTSRLWQKEISVEEFNGHFGTYYSDAESYGIMSRLKPVIDEASMSNKSQFLTLKGHYPIKPTRVYFEQNYVYEGTRWKLLGLGVSPGSPGD